MTLEFHAWGKPGLDETGKRLIRASTIYIASGCNYHKMNGLGSNDNQGRPMPGI